MATVHVKKLRRTHGPVARAIRSIKPAATFFREFVKHPGMIGSIIPSSRALVNTVLEDVDWPNVRLFVEYGPGVGTFTRPILEKLPVGATLIAIDTNAGFVRMLNAEVADYRFKAVLGSAEDVVRIIGEHGFAEADYVLSGLPFSTLPKGVGDKIASETERALRPGGQFLVYQYSSFVMKILAPYFAQVIADSEWRNIPPCKIFRAYKTRALAQAA